MTPKRIALAVLLLVVLFVGALFTVQNGGRVSGLSLSFGFSGGAFQLSEPLPVPWLMWVAFSVGLLLGGGWGMWQRFSAGQQVRELQRKLARASTGTGSDPWKS